MSEKNNNAPGQGGEGAGNNPPAPAPAPSPAAPVVTPPAASQDEMVTIKKSDLEAMKGRQSALDIRENRLKKREQKLGRGQSFKFNQPAQNPNPPANPQGNDDDGTEEDRRAERGLINLALRPEYRDVLDANPTLRDMLTRNPLSALPIYAPDAIDAEDAVDLMKEKLEEFRAAHKPTPPQNAPQPTKQDDTPTTGGENQNAFGRPVATEGMQDPEYRDHLKGGKTKDIAQALKHRINRSIKR